MAPHRVTALWCTVVGFQLWSAPFVDAAALIPGGGSKKATFAGFDLGTSGARISIIEKAEEDGELEEEEESSPGYREVYSDSLLWDAEKNPYNDPSSWMEAVQHLMRNAPGDLRSRLRSLCVSGTSASCLLVDALRGGKVTRMPRMYHYHVTNSASPEELPHAVRAMQRLERFAPENHTAKSPTGSLAKLLAWMEEAPLQRGEVLCHQSDYVSWRLTSNGPLPCGAGSLAATATQEGITSDWHNCLKLGFDVQKLEWPEWLVACLRDSTGLLNPLEKAMIPRRVISPGQVMGFVSPSMAPLLGLEDPDTKKVAVVGGTTDSNAAFLAAVGGTTPPVGTAVTSLGSTLALKQLSTTFCQDAQRGVYSHRFPRLDSKEEEEEEEAWWLVGGASNVGLAVLRQWNFTTEELESRSRQLDPNVDAPYHYYPLAIPKGERFPQADSEKVAVLTPRPDDRGQFLYNILFGITNVEAQGYEALGALGATPSVPTHIWTCGGGARNPMWIQMRQRRLSRLLLPPTNDDTTIPVQKAHQTEASFGAAILAAATFRPEKQ